MRKTVIAMVIAIVATGCVAQEPPKPYGLELGTSSSWPAFEVLRVDDDRSRSLVQCDSQFKSCKLGDGVTLEDLVRTVRDIGHDDATHADDLQKACSQRLHDILYAWKMSLPKPAKPISSIVSKEHGVLRIEGVYLSCPIGDHLAAIGDRRACLKEDGSIDDDFPEVRP